MAILGSLEFGARTGFPTTLSTSINLGSSANRWLILISQVIGASSSVWHVGATIGGVALTAHGNASMQTLAGTPGQVAAFSLAGGTVPTGVQTLNVTRNDAGGWNQLGYVVWGDGQATVSTPTAAALVSGAAFSGSRASAAGDLVIFAAHLLSSGAGPVTVTPTAPAIGLNGTGSGAEISRPLAIHTAGAATASVAATISGSQFAPAAIYQAWTLAPAGSGDTTPPAVTGPGGATGSTASITVEAGSTLVFDYSANEAATWDKNGGANQSLFNIDPVTGVLSFAAPAVAGSYVVGVRATDAASNPTTQTLTVTVVAPPPPPPTPPPPPSNGETRLVAPILIGITTEGKIVHIP